MASALQRVLDLLARRQLSIPVTKLPALDDVAAAQQLLAERRGAGKYVAAAL